MRGPPAVETAGCLTLTPDGEVLGVADAPEGRMQSQFLTVVDRDEAERRFRAALDLSPLAAEVVPLADALGRVLADDLPSPVDVPGFDRSNVDGFAVRAESTFGATEDAPVRLTLNAETVSTGVVPRLAVGPGSATLIATGGVVPRGADAVVMVEHTRPDGGAILLTRPSAPGAHVTSAGTDVGCGETVLRRGDLLTSRETGVLAALGVDRVWVVRRPRVAVLSTGDEVVPPGRPLPVGCVYDSNGTALADAVRELGGEPVRLGVVPDDENQLERVLVQALECDAVLLSGGTSKGAGDVSYRVAGRLGPPGVLAHGVALKPGKPLCLAAVNRPGRRPVPVAVLPGFPTSALFTFHEFVAPVLRRMAGRPEGAVEQLAAVLPARLNSERGRTEYVLVGLTRGAGGELSALPLGMGSGSVTAFARADGFVSVPRNREYLERGERVSVTLTGARRPADVVVIGSHCVGLDLLLGELRGRGFTAKTMWVGSAGGLEAARRGDCDLAGVHLLDPATGEYNRPFLPPGVELWPGYGRMQGVVFRRDDGRLAGRGLAGVLAAAAGPDCLMVNRNRGSGTRTLIDELLAGARPAGYRAEARSHNAVAAAVAQGRADWGVAIEAVTRGAGLAFLPVRAERYDFLVPASRAGRPALLALREVLGDPAVRARLAALGFEG